MLECAAPAPYGQPGQPEYSGQSGPYGPYEYSAAPECAAPEHYGPPEQAAQSAQSGQSEQSGQTASPRVRLPRAFAPLFQPHRYKIFYGGRGAAKSWAFVRALLILAASRPLRILCARELQVSITDSVHRLLADQIHALGLTPLFTVHKNAVRSLCGSEFLFKGLRHNAQEIKSLEGVDICWVEEAESVSRESWDLLIPTIRREHSEIWVSFNPGSPDDDTWRRFVLSPPAGALVAKVGWQDNPWFPRTLHAEKEYCARVDPEAHAHIWEGQPRCISEAQVFKGRYLVQPFESPENAHFHHGVDWGFAKDPTVLVRAFVQDQVLYVDAEAYAVGVELDEIPRLFDTIPTARHWPLKADAARPETISHLRRKGYHISGAEKWSGSVQDGLALLKSFERIVVHPRCVHTAEEMRLYSYKTDRITGQILPLLQDMHNHCIDALRYAFDGFARGHGPMRLA